MRRSFRKFNPPPGTPPPVAFELLRQEWSIAFIIAQCAVVKCLLEFSIVFKLKTMT